MSASVEVASGADVVSGAGSQPIEQDRTVIGRSPSADIVVQARTVSARHAEIVRQGPAWLLRDLGSTNGTKLNGSRVRQAVLQSGDEIGIGPSTLVFRCEVEPCCAPRDGPPGGGDHADSTALTQAIEMWTLLGHLVEPSTRVPGAEPHGRTAQRLALLCRMITEMAGLTTAEAVCRTVVTFAGTLIGVDCAAVYPSTAGGSEVPSATFGKCPPLTIDRIRELAKSDSQVVTVGASIAIVPLSVREDRMGFLVAEKNRGRGFEMEDLRLLTILGCHGAILLKNARLYADLVEANRGLEAKVRERTAEVEARAREVESLSGEKDRLLEMVAHDVRSPLTAIILYAQMLRTDASGREEIDGGLSSIEALAQRMARLVGDLLDVSTISSGTVRVHPKAVGASAFLSQCLDQHRPQAAARRIALEARLPEPDRSILVDPERMRQVISNLVENAIKHCPAGTRILLTATPSEDGGVTIGVEDDGPGLAPEVLERFTSGETRGHPTEESAARKGTAKGYGLGLAIAHRLLELQGTTLDVRSARGQGTTFSFCCPAA